MNKLEKYERILRRLDGYEEEVKGQRKHNILCSENVYINDVKFLLSEIRRIKKESK